MKVISILNKKGGVGKTTISTNLAHGLQLRGFKVLLADGDPQGSARDWHSANGGGLLTCVGLDRDTIVNDIEKLSNQYDVVIIDGAPQIDKLAIAAVKASDVVLIPVMPSPYDIWATEDLVNIINSIYQFFEKPRAAFVINRVIKNTNLSKEVCEALKEYNFPIVRSFLSQYIAYARSAETGTTVFSNTSSSQAAEEFGRFVEEVIERYLNI